MASLRWQPERPRLRVGRLVAAWVASALRLPFTVAIGFVLVLALDAAMLLLAADIAPEQLRVDDFWAAIAVAIIAAAVSMAIGAVTGVDDDDGYTLRLGRRVARRTGTPTAADAPGILFLEIDGLALPVLRRAVRDGTTPNMARWLAGGSHRLLEWETDVAFALVRSAQDGPVVNAARHLRRTDGFAHVPDIVVNSFFDPATEEGCAFEELISFHGGLGGPQAQPFILHPARLAAPDEPLVGAESVHRLLRTWRATLGGTHHAERGARPLARS